MSKIEIEKFQQLCSLSDSAMLWLIKNSSLPLEFGPQKQLLIETGSLDTKEIVKMIAQRRKESPIATKRLMIEKLGGLLSKELESLIDEALEGA